MVFVDRYNLETIVELGVASNESFHCLSPA